LQHVQETDVMTWIYRMRSEDGAYSSAGPRLGNTLPVHLRRSATVSDSLNGCWRPICSVFVTAALC